MNDQKGILWTHLRCFVVALLRKKGAQPNCNFIGPSGCINRYGQLSWIFTDFRAKHGQKHLPPEFANRSERKPEFQKPVLRKLQTICQNLS